MLKNSLNCLNIHYKKIWKILKLKKWPKTMIFDTFSWIINEPDFSRTNGRVSFLVLSCWSCMPSFGKILRAVFEKKCWQIWVALLTVMLQAASSTSGRKKQFKQQAATLQAVSFKTCYATDSLPSIVTLLNGLWACKWHIQWSFFGFFHIRAH